MRHRAKELIQPLEHKFFDEISQTHCIYTTRKIVYKFHVSIYNRENAINIGVQLKVLLNIFLGL